MTVPIANLMIYGRRRLPLHGLLAFGSADHHIGRRDDRDHRAVGVATLNSGKKGLLLINLGTPNSPSVKDVRRYLREFLNDPDVLGMSAVGRWFLLNFVILPFRPATSAAMYQTIWTNEGSPLLVHGRALKKKVAEQLGDAFHVELAMRYGQPSLKEAFGRFYDAGIHDVVVFPMFPQNAAATTGTIVKAVEKAAGPDTAVTVVPPYYDNESFVRAFAEPGRAVLGQTRPDHVLFSFHGLPEAHVRKADATGQHCLQKEDCCARISRANRHCYRAQSFATARALAATLGLGPEQHTVCFQSRFGRTAWIRPYTEELLQTLPERGIKTLVVFCPAFVADCLETLEEIALRGLDTFRKAGGSELHLIPSLNSSDTWVDAVVSLVRQASPSTQ